MQVPISELASLNREPVPCVFCGVPISALGDENEARYWPTKPATEKKATQLKCGA